MQTVMPWNHRTTMFLASPRCSGLVDGSGDLLWVSNRVSQLLSSLTITLPIDLYFPFAYIGMLLFQEPSLFAVAKLLETGLVNLPRVEVLWRPLTNHLLEVCQHPHIRMREWGVEATTYLVKAALQHKHQPPLKDNQVTHALILVVAILYC